MSTAEKVDFFEETPQQLEGCLTWHVGLALSPRARRIKLQATTPPLWTAEMCSMEK